MNKAELFVPGRLCLFGEHSDWAGSYRRINGDIVPGQAIVCGIDQGISATVERCDSLKVLTVLPHENTTELFECPMDLKRLREIACEGGFFSYAAGVTAYILEHYHVNGVFIRCEKMTLPIKKGLSSSAAFCVLIARAFNILYNLQLSARGEMEIAYRGEIMTPSRCGRMDQACAFGQRAVHMVFDGDRVDIDPIIIGEDLYWVFADLKGRKNTKKILSDLNKCFPFAQNEFEENIQKTFGNENEKIVQDVLNKMAQGDAQAIGELMLKAQEIFDRIVMPACPTELYAPKLHEVLNDKQVKCLTYGGKGVGSQGDGSVQFIAKGKKEQELLVNYICNSLMLEAYPFTIKRTKKVRKAIIPLAGFGTRLFPATKLIKKDLFPVIDIDGIAKPALLILLEELDQAGIEEIGIIISPEDETTYNKLLNHDLNDEHFCKLSQQMKEYDKKIRRIGKKVKFIFQKERLGFGHAVLQSKSFSNNEPILLLLGDHIYRSFCGKTCAEQAINAYELDEMLTLLIEKIEITSVSNYGIVTGEWKIEPMKLEVTQISEKPDIDYAREYLGIKNKNSSKDYYSIFGQYIITPDVFRILEKNVNEGLLENGEYQLTSVLDEVRRIHGAIAVVPIGKRFDIGIPESYLNTLTSFQTLRKSVNDESLSINESC